MTAGEGAELINPLIEPDSKKKAIWRQDPRGEGRSNPN